MNNKMTRTIRDKAEQYIRRDVRKWYHELKKKKESWMLAALAEGFIIAVLVVVMIII